MPDISSRIGITNRVLLGLSRTDFALLKPHLVSADLPVGTYVETANSGIDNVYFIESGFASVVADGAGKRSIEVGIIGREGMTGLAVVLGDERASHDTYIQVAGSGQRISAPKLRWPWTRAFVCTGRFYGALTPSSFRQHRRHSPMAAARMRNAWPGGC